VNDLYYVEVDGERLYWDGMEAIPLYDASHAATHALVNGANEVTITRMDGEDEEVENPGYEGDVYE